MIYIVDENGDGIVVLGRDGSFVGRQLSMGWNEGLLYPVRKPRCLQRG
jgi:hypothetical protein